MESFLKIIKNDCPPPLKNQRKHYKMSIIEGNEISKLLKGPYAKSGFNAVYDMNTPCEKKMIYRKTKRKLSHKKQLKHSFPNEVYMSILTSRKQISPLVYYSGIDPSGYGVIILQKYENSLRGLLKKYDINQKNVERNLSILFEKLASLNVFCWDLKLGNVVGDYNPTTSKLTLRLIDFDMYFCNSKIKLDNDVTVLALKIILSANTKYRTPYTLFQTDIKEYITGTKRSKLKLFHALELISEKPFKTVNRYREKHNLKIFKNPIEMLKDILKIRRLKKT